MYKLVLQEVEENQKEVSLKDVPKTFGELKYNDVIYHNEEILRCIDGELDYMGMVDLFDRKKEMVNAFGKKKEFGINVKFDKFLGPVSIDIGILNK